MSDVRLLSVGNVQRRHAGSVRQELCVVARTHGAHGDARVDVAWSGVDGAWHQLPAQCHTGQGTQSGLWCARALFDARDGPLPGDLRLAVQLHGAGVDAWDNRGGLNHQVPVGRGPAAVRGVPLQMLPGVDALEEGQRAVVVRVATDPAPGAGAVRVRWTTDDWRTTQETVCGRSSSSGTWRACLKVGAAARVRYCAALDVGGVTHWDNNEGADYLLARRRLTVLVLNLHCGQEADQDHKLSVIARAMDELDVDIACFQEVAEPWNNGAGDAAVNQARVISSRLAAPFHVHADWSHRGFDRFREGVAVLSRHPITWRGSRWVSTRRDPGDMHARRVVLAGVQVPGMGLVNVFSVHLSWWEDGFRDQWSALCAWAAEQHVYGVAATVLAGDFNVPAGSPGHRLVVDGGAFEDAFAAARADPAAVPRVEDAHWRPLREDNARIDYLFLRRPSALRVTTARVLFTEADYGRVSDHCGYLFVLAAGGAQR